MGPHIRRQNMGIARVGAALLALALVVRLLVPYGWMPAAQGGFAIELCTGQGVVVAWVDDEGNVHQDKPDGKQTDQPCAFSGLSLPFDLSGPGDAPAAPFLDAAFASVALPVVAIGRGLAAPPPPATGPPLSL